MMCQCRAGQPLCDFVPLLTVCAVDVISDTHAALRLLSAVVEGEYVLPVVLSDSGTPALAEIHMVNVTVCQCNDEGDCQPILAAIFSAGMGLSLGALLIILGSVVLLLCTSACALASHLFYCKPCHCSDLQDIRRHKFY